MILSLLFKLSGVIGLLFGIVLLVQPPLSVGLLAALPVFFSALVCFGIAQLIDALERIATATERTAALLTGDRKPPPAPTQLDKVAEAYRQR